MSVSAHCSFCLGGGGGGGGYSGGGGGEGDFSFFLTGILLAAGAAAAASTFKGAYAMNLPGDPGWEWRSRDQRNSSSGGPLPAVPSSSTWAMMMTGTRRARGSRPSAPQGLVGRAEGRLPSSLTPVSRSAEAA